MADKKEWSEMTKKEKAGGLIVLAVVAIIIIVVISSIAGGSKDKKATDNNVAASPTSGQTKESDTKKPAKRRVTGTATTLGAGTFTGGKDVAVGLYDVTPGAGQSGNFIVQGTDTYNEILGNAGAAGGVDKVRTQISNGDKIQISGLSSVTFTPVKTPFVTSHSPVNLYAGTFIVGEDVGAGRYTVTPGSGQSGNFIVSGADTYNEILGGDSAYGGVPKVSVSLTKGDEITISGLSQVTFTPRN